MIIILCAAVMAAFCLLLTWKLQKFANLDRGIGAAVLDLSRRAEELQTSITEGRRATELLILRLEMERAKAEATAVRLEILLASVHDLIDVQEDVA